MKEQLAAIQYKIWSHWMRYLFSVCVCNEDASITIPSDTAARWIKQMNTSYSDLSEQQKESDRHQADKVIAVLRGAKCKMPCCKQYGAYWILQEEEK